MSFTTAPSMASSTKPSPTANTKPNRLPAPTLFVGPPSRNASQLSLGRQAANDPKARLDPLSRQKSALSRPAHNDASPAEASHEDDFAFAPLKKQSEKEVEAKWKEMQSTLNEVELTAQSSTHVFGERHAAALDDLRRAQVELAHAWGRGNEDKATAGTTENDLEANINRFKGAEDLALDRAQRRRGNTQTSASTALSDESAGTNTASRSAGGARSQLEDETAQDIKLASERRAANEAYFKKVDGSVKDVVAKLEAVAEAMRGVESESRSLWSGSESSDSSRVRQGTDNTDSKEEQTLQKREHGREASG